MDMSIKGYAYELIIRIIIIIKVKLDSLNVFNYGNKSFGFLLPVQ